MAGEVIKKDGTKEPFNPVKIRNSIVAAAQRTDLSEERQDEVAEEVTATVIEAAKEKEEITTLEIREKILDELDSIEPTVSDAWRKYEQEKKGV